MKHLTTKLVAVMAAFSAFAATPASAAIVPTGSVTADMVTDFTAAGATYNPITGEVSQAGGTLHCQPGFSFGATCGLVAAGATMENNTGSTSRAYFANGTLFDAVEITFSATSDVTFTIEALGMQYTQAFAAGMHTLLLDFGAQVNLLTILLGSGDDVTISSISTGMAVDPVPLPAAGVFLLTGLAGAAALRLRNKNAASA